MHGNRKVLPTDFFPDYLKADLGVGSKSESFLTQFLDAVGRGILNESMRQTCGIQVQARDARGQRQFWKQMGFFVETLKDEEVFALTGLRNEILGQSNFKRAVERLASVYFGSCEVRRGREEGPSPLKPSESIHLSDRADRDSLLFIRAPEDFSQEREREFTHNVYRVVPPFYEVLVARPKRHLIPATRAISLTRAIRMAERRL